MSLKPLFTVETFALTRILMMYLTQWLQLYFNKSKMIKHAPLFWKYGLNILWSGYLKICLKVQFISILDYNRFHS